MTRRTIRLFIVAMCIPMFSTIGLAAGCVDVASEANELAPEIAQKKADYAIAAISDLEYQVNNSSCVVANMRYLGFAHVQKAIPALIALLGYKVAPRPLRRPATSDIYPAINALHNIGEPAVPALLEVIAKNENDSVESKNAIDALMNICRENLDKGLRRLKEAADKEVDSARGNHLRRAIQDARAEWCAPAACTE